MLAQVRTPIAATCKSVLQMKHLLGQKKKLYVSQAPPASPSTSLHINNFIAFPVFTLKNRLYITVSLGRP